MNTLPNTVGGVPESASSMLAATPLGVVEAAAPSAGASVAAVGEATMAPTRSVQSIASVTFGTSDRPNSRAAAENGPRSDGPHRRHITLKFMEALVAAYKKHMPQDGNFSSNHYRRRCWQAVTSNMNALPADVRGCVGSLTEGYVRQTWANKVNAVKRKLRELSGSTVVTAAELMRYLGAWAQNESVAAVLLECARGAGRDTNTDRRKQSGWPGPTNAGPFRSMCRSGENASAAVQLSSSAKRKRDSVRTGRDTESQWDSAEPTPEEVQQSRALRSLMKDVNGRRRAKRPTLHAQMLDMIRASNAQTASFMKEVSQALNLMTKHLEALS